MWNWIKELFSLWFFNGYSMMYDHIGGIGDPLKQDPALGFSRNQNKVIRILIETHINHDQIHHIRKNWLGSNFFSLRDSHTKWCFSCFIWDLKGDTDPKVRFVLFTFTPSNGRVLCVYAHSGYRTREQLDMGRVFEGLQNYMENKNKGYENKI